MQRRVIVNGIDSIWSADLVDMQAFARINKGFKHLLTVIDVFSKYAWCVPLKNKTGASVVEAFTGIIKKSGRKPQYLWVDRGGEFYNRVVDSWLKQQDIHRYSTYNEGKAVVIERFNRTLKTAMWKYFTARNTNRYIDVLDRLVHQYNSRAHSSTSMSPVEASKKSNEMRVLAALNTYPAPKHKRPKFKVGDRVRISKYKTLFEKGYTPNWTTEVFEINNVFLTTPTTYKIKDVNGEVIEGTFYELELQKTTSSLSF